MAITMYQADRNYVTPANDGSLYSAMLNNTSGIINNRGNNFALTADGLVVSIDTGQAIIGGRLVEITTAESVTVPANSSGNICLVVDLTKTNDVSGNAGDSSYSVTVNQVYTSAVTGSLTQDDLNNGGFIYELPLASFTSTATAVTLTNVMNYIGKAVWQSLSLPTGGAFHTGGYARYSVLNGVVYLDFESIDTYGTPNSNQLFSIPSAIQPKSVNGEVLKNYWVVNLVTGASMNSTQAHLFTAGNGSVAYISWYAALGTKTTQISGHISYPLG